MHRIQLSPAPASAVISARVVVTVLIALVQMAIFLLVATIGFGLRLSGDWYLSVPLLVAGTLSFMAVGLFAGAISKTAESAVNTANFLVLPMAFLRPLSGSGAFAVMSEIVTVHGPDSLTGLLACTIQGSTETTFYVLTLYAGAAGVKDLRFALAACLIGDLAGLLAATAAVHALYG